MFQRLIPDRIFDNVYQITPELIKNQGKQAVIFDIDNTLTCDKNADPDEKLRNYLSSLTQSGIRVALVSNNNTQRVERFNRTLGFFVTPKAGKPKRSALDPSIRHFGVAKEQILFVGDQILTDILAAKRNDLTAFLVKPINPYENGFFYIKRVLEKPFLRAYYRKNAEAPK